MSATRQCVHCSEPLPSPRNTTYCSKACQLAHTKKNHYELEDGVCKECKQPYQFKRNADQRSKQSPWANSMFCSRQCIEDSRAWQKDTKQCLICDETFSPSLRSGRALWVRRRFCSTKCSGKDQEKEPIYKHCEQCNDKFYKTSHSDEQFEQMRFCSRQCLGTWRKEHYDELKVIQPLCTTCQKRPSVRGREICTNCYVSWKWRNDSEYQARVEATNKQWREDNPDYWKQERILEKAKTRTKEWVKNNPDKAKENNRRAKLRRRKAEAEIEYDDRKTMAEWCTILLKDPCTYCGEPATSIDHIVPISKRGGHVQDNVTACCGSCNTAKLDRDMLFFMLRQAQRHDARRNDEL